MEPESLAWVYAFWEEIRPEEMMTLEELGQKIQGLNGQEFVMSVPLGGEDYGR